ncbi:MAG: hypothetical protein GY842_28335 [bacterium]|nr:hypothetical protein [bacterium]
MSRQILGLLVVTLLFAPAAWAAQNILFNGSMEQGEGSLSEDPMIPAEWTLQGSVVERSAEANLVPVGEGYSLKAFSSEPQELAYQEVAVSSGDSVVIGASLYTRSADKLSGDAQAAIVLEFYRANGTVTGGTNILFVLDAASPADTWIPASVGPHAAPADAVAARMTCLWLWSGIASGSAYWDDCSLTVNGGANALLNADFEQAGVGAQSPFGIDFWSGFNDQEKSEDHAQHGVASVAIGTTEVYSGLYQEMKVLDEGDRILVKAKVFNTSTNGLTDDARAGIKLEFAPPAGSSLPPPTENLAFGESSPVDSWELVDLGTTGLTVPDGANFARVVMIYVNADTPTNGAVYVDAAWAELASAPGSNQLSNASFELGQGGANGLDDWEEFNTPGVSQAQKSDFEVPGYPDELFESSMKAFGDAPAGIIQDIAVTTGDTLTVSAYMRHTSANPLAGTGRAGVKVEWVGGSLPPDIDITAGPSDNTITATSPKDTWIDLFIDFTMPADTQAIPRFVNLVAAGTTGTGVAYFDVCEAVVLNGFDGADADGDDDEDLADFAEFQRCYSGDGVTPLRWNCTVFDSDDDEDVDLTDYAYFQPRLTGP